LVGADTAVVSWWRRAASGAELGIREVSRSGELGPIRVLATSDETRPDSVPQILRSGDRLLLVWTEPGEPARIAAAYAKLGPRH